LRLLGAANIDPTSRETGRRRSVETSTMRPEVHERQRDECAANEFDLLVLIDSSTCHRRRDEAIDEAQMSRAGQMAAHAGRQQDGVEVTLGLFSEVSDTT
jgi:hypothetical protein